MSDLIPGCTAIVVNSYCPENLGKIVKVGSFIGRVKGFQDSEYWEVSQPMLAFYGGYFNFIGASKLQRIDDHKEKEKNRNELISVG